MVDTLHRNLYRTETMLINEFSDLWNMIVSHHEINAPFSQDPKQFLMIDIVMSIESLSCAFLSSSIRRVNKCNGIFHARPSGQ